MPQCESTSRMREETPGEIYAVSNYHNVKKPRVAEGGLKLSTFEWHHKARVQIDWTSFVWEKWCQTFEWNLQGRETTHNFCQTGLVSISAYFDQEFDLRIVNVNLFKMIAISHHMFGKFLWHQRKFQATTYSSMDFRLSTKRSRWYWLSEYF